MLKILICLIITFISSQSWGQKLEVNGKEYVHGEKIIDKISFEDLLKNDVEAYEYYAKSQKQYKEAKILGFSSLGLFAIGIWSFSLDALDPSIESSMLIFSSYVVGTAGIITKIKAKRNKATSLLLYNHNRSDDEQTYKIDLSLQGNGLGLTYSF